MSHQGRTPSADPDPFADDQLADLVSRALELRDAGETVDFAALCGARPDLIEAVRESLEASSRFTLLQRSCASYDRLAGRTLDGRYRLESRLGAGAMGVVYRGEDLELRRPVAVKILRSAFLDGEEAEFRFSREAEVLAAIDHPSVVTIHDRGRTSDDDPYLVMELLNGAPLSQVLEDGKLAGVTAHAQDTAWVARMLGVASLDDQSYLRTVVRWAADLASGLGAAHEKGILHRDVKPSNVFLRCDGRPVLLDFGIAARASQATITRDGAPLGTPAYMAPEALDPSSAPSAALDVYGLAATLYHLLTFRAPYTGSPSQIITTLLVQDVVPARQLREGLPRDLQAILDCGLARRPGDRYATAADFEADLRAFLDHRPVRARRITAVQRLWRRARRSSAFRAGVGVAVLGLLALGAGEWRRAWLDARALQLAQVWRHLPPNLAIVRPEDRRIVDEQQRRHVERLLDESVALSSAAAPASLLRAAFRLDQGDARGAAQDMHRIADGASTAYVDALAERYDALPEGAEGDAQLDLSGLPEPRTEWDVYVAAFHSMRARRHSQAKELLADPRLADDLCAQEMRIPLVAADAHEMYERTVWLEERRGLRTASSAYLLGTALTLQGRYDRALPILEEGLALSPRSHVLHLNAGLVALRLERFDAARAHLEVARELRPGHLLSYENLVRVLMATGDLEEAAEIAASAPFGDDEDARCQRLLLLGVIETEAALAHVREGRAELGRAAAQRATDIFDEARGLQDDETEVAHARISAALLRDDPTPVFTGLLEVLADEPASRRRLNLLVDWMPEELTASQTAELGRFLTTLADELEAHQSDEQPGE